MTDSSSPGELGDFPSCPQKWPRQLSNNCSAANVCQTWPCVRFSNLSQGQGCRFGILKTIKDVGVSQKTISGRARMLAITGMGSDIPHNRRRGKIGRAHLASVYCRRSPIWATCILFPAKDCTFGGGKCKARPTSSQCMNGWHFTQQYQPI